MEARRGINWTFMSRLVGMLLLVEAGVMLLSVVLSLIYHDGYFVHLLVCMGVYAVIGFVLRNNIGRYADYTIREQDSFWATFVVWTFIPISGILPYIVTGVIPSVLDALFESVSGFTTTGSTVVPQPELMPPSLLVWRSLTQWLGGMGLVLFLVGAVHKMHVGSFFLYDAEFSGTAQRRLHPHISHSVRLMGLVYIIETLALLILLIAFGNDAVDALCLTFSTVSTGGFMTSAHGLSHCNDASLAVISLWMLVGGINLALLYNIFSFRFSRLKESNELRAYLMVFVVVVALSTLLFVIAGNEWGNSFCYSLFHVASTISTTGYFVESSLSWSFGVVVLTMLLMMMGACTGSSGGGIKVKRVMIIARYIKNYFTRMVHPQAVFNVKVDGMVISDEYNNKVFAFVFMYISFVLGGAFVLTFSGVDVARSLVLAAANMGNIGPTPMGGNLGVMMTYADLSAISKVVLMVLMIAGRIEVFALVAFFSPSYWKRMR